jgi:hypothetical protein
VLRPLGKQARVAGREGIPIFILLLRVQTMMFPFSRRAMVSSSLLFLFTLVAPLRADETAYLPAGAWMIYSFDVAAFVKSKAYTEARKQIPEFDKVLEMGLKDTLGVPLGNVARLSAGAGGEKEGMEEFSMVITTLKPVTAGDIKATRKPRPYQKNFTYKEVKLGAHTLYEENYQFEFKATAGQDKGDKQPAQATVQGSAFCILEGKYVLHGPQRTLKAILDRNNKPALSSGIAAALKQKGLVDPLTLILDFQGMPQREKKNMLREFDKPFAGVGGVIDRLQTARLSVSGEDTIRATVSLQCKDDATAGEVKKIAETGLATIKGMLIDDPKLPAQVQEMIKDVRTTLGNVKVSTQGPQANVEVAVSAASAARAVRAVFEINSAETKSEPIPKAPPIEKK